MCVEELGNYFLNLAFKIYLCLTNSFETHLFISSLSFDPLQDVPSPCFPSELREREGLYGRTDLCLLWFPRAQLPSAF